MISADFVINAYARNLHFIKTYTEGFSQADSLIQPPAKANCANWIVGHIAAYRNRLLDVLGQPPVIDPQLGRPLWQWFGSGVGGRVGYRSI